MYKHFVQYYETDKMGITHHSNYIRFMEEARVQFFKNIGFDYAELEQNGIFSPVVEIGCKFVKPTHFNDEIFVDIKIIQYSGVRLAVHYLMYSNDCLVFEGNSKHCFLSAAGKVVRLGENNFPKLHEKLKSLCE